MYWIVDFVTLLLFVKMFSLVLRNRPFKPIIIQAIIWMNSQHRLIRAILNVCEDFRVNSWFFKQRDLMY